MRAAFLQARLAGAFLCLGASAPDARRSSPLERRAFAMAGRRADWLRACRPSRIAFKRLSMLSISSALAESIFRSMFGCPSGANIEPMSSSEKPAARPRRNQRQLIQHRLGRTGGASPRGRWRQSGLSLHKSEALRRARPLFSRLLRCP